MNARVEAAHNAILAYKSTRGIDNQENAMSAALAAADAVMFDDAAVERAAKAAYDAQMEDGDTPWEGFGGSSYLDYWRDTARAVIAALKGDGA